MIDRNVFANWMGALGARIAKEAPPQLVAVYYDTLSRHLDTAQFEVALSRMVHRPSEYFTAWPSPTEIVAAAQLQRTFDTAAEFAKLESVLRLCVPNLPIIPQLEAHCDPRTVRAFEALGGLARYRRLTDFEASGYRREFLDRLKEMVEHEVVGRLTAPHVLPPTVLPSAPAKHTNHNPHAAPPGNAELVTAEVVAASGRSWREEVGPRPTPVDRSTVSTASTTTVHTHQRTAVGPQPRSRTTTDANANHVGPNEWRHRMRSTSPVRDAAVSRTE